MHKILLTGIIAVLLCVPTATRAAALSIFAGDGRVEVGHTITVSLRVDTEGTAINAAEGVLQFPSELFDLVSITTSSSIFSLWVQQPAALGPGRISFNGGVPSPGYTGQSGRIISATLRAKKPGDGSFTASQAAVRANDGFGTDVLRVVKSSPVFVTSTSPEPPVDETPSAAEHERDNGREEAIGQAATSSQPIFEATSTLAVHQPQARTFEGLMPILLITTLLLTCLSLLMNALLWGKLRSKDVSTRRLKEIDSLQRNTYQKLASAKKELQRQCKEIERAKTKKGVSPQDAALLQDIYKSVQEATVYLEGKARDLTKR